MKCISQNVIGNIFVSNKVIDKTIEFDFININHEIKLQKINSEITSDDDLYVEAEVIIKKNKMDKSIKDLNITIEDKIKKILQDNFKLKAKNISIIYNFDLTKG